MNDATHWAQAVAAVPDVPEELRPLIVKMLGHAYFAGREDEATKWRDDLRVHAAESILPVDQLRHWVERFEARVLDLESERGRSMERGKDIS